MSVTPTKIDLSIPILSPDGRSHIFSDGHFVAQDKTFCYSLPKSSSKYFETLGHDPKFLQTPLILPEFSNRVYDYSRKRGSPKIADLALHKVWATPKRKSKSIKPPFSKSISSPLKKQKVEKSNSTGLTPLMKKSNLAKLTEVPKQSVINDKSSSNIFSFLKKLVTNT